MRISREWVESQHNIFIAFHIPHFDWWRHRQSFSLPAIIPRYIALGMATHTKLHTVDIFQQILAICPFIAYWFAFKRLTILSWPVIGQTACSLHLLWVLRGRDIETLTLALWNLLICVSKRLRHFCISRCVGLAMEWLINHWIVTTFNSKLELRYLVRT